MHSSFKKIVDYIIKYNNIIIVLVGGVLYWSIVGTGLWRFISNDFKIKTTPIHYKSFNFCRILIILV